MIWFGLVSFGFGKEEIIGTVEGLQYCSVLSDEFPAFLFGFSVTGISFTTFPVRIVHSKREDIIIILRTSYY